MRCRAEPKRKINFRIKEKSFERKKTFFNARQKIGDCKMKNKNRELFLSVMAGREIDKFSVAIKRAKQEKINELKYERHEK